jgi:hypothetical protein
VISRLSFSDAQEAAALQTQRWSVGLSQIIDRAHVPSQGAAPKSQAEDRVSDRITASTHDDEPVPMSIDCDASDRTFDRQLAHLGLLDDAAPLFRDGSSVPGTGILLAVPCLVESGLFRISRKLYGEIGPAFYGLRTLLTLLLMALLRIKRPEQLKEAAPGDCDRASRSRPRRAPRPAATCRH